MSDRLLRDRAECARKDTSDHVPRARISDRGIISIRGTESRAFLPKSFWFLILLYHLFFFFFFPLLAAKKCHLLNYKPKKTPSATTPKSKLLTKHEAGYLDWPLFLPRVIYLQGLQELVLFLNVQVRRLISVGRLHYRLPKRTVVSWPITYPSF